MGCGMTIAGAESFRILSQSRKDGDKKKGKWRPKRLSLNSTTSSTPFDPNLVEGQEGK